MISDDLPGDAATSSAPVPSERAGEGPSPDERPVRIVLVEDCDADAELVQHELAQAGLLFALSRVETADALRAAMGGGCDVVLSDFNLPQLDALRALAVVREQQRETPFVIVSGSVGEDIAAAAMRAGANDYVLKGNLTRLPGVVLRALEEARSRRALVVAEHQARSAEASLELFQRIAARMPTGVAVIEVEPGAAGPSVREVWRNPAASMAGEALSAQLVRSLHGGGSGSSERPLPEVLAEVVARKQSVELPELRQASDDGEEHVFAVSASPLGDNQVGVFFEDITDRRRREEEHRRTEEQLRGAQRMEAVGRLAGGIAHDFNNVLTVIQSYARFVRDDLGEGHSARADLDTILSASGRAAKLTSQLLAFSRRQVQALANVSINDTVRDLDDMLRRALGADIQLVVELAEDLDLARVDVSQLEQVLLNLVINARDAMRSGGTLQIATTNEEVRSGGRLSELVGVPPGPYVVLAVTDDGTGMDAETLGRIFDPFFTTKGEGSGLGLSTVYGIIKQSNGFIFVDSELGKGSRFRIYLPRAQGPRAASRPEASDPAPGHETTILVAEDEEFVRSAVRRVLRKRGYQVIEARDGLEALQLYDTHEGQIDLLITDIVMPQMGGRELAERLAAVRPGLKTIFMSGYTDTAITQHKLLDEGAVFVQKPFTPEQLMVAVRRVLGG